MMKDKGNFFGNLLGSVSSLSFYATVPEGRHPFVVLHLLLLSSIVLAVTLIPFASRMTAVAKRYVSYYDQRFPEIHIEGNRVLFVGSLPSRVELENGVQVIVDTTGAFASLENLPAASVLVTNRGVEVKSRHGVRRYAFDSLRASVPLTITPQNAPTLLNQVLTVGIAVLAVGGVVAFLVLGFIAALLGAGYVLLLDALRHGRLRPNDAFAVAVYALTPFTVVLGVVLLAGLFSGSFLLVLWLGYCLLLAVVVIRIHRGVALETR